MSATQGNVDLLVSEFFKKQQEALSKKNAEDNAPQPFSQFILVQYFLDEFNSTFDPNMSEEERQQHALEIALKVKSLLAMTTGEIKEYFRVLDEEKRDKINRENDRVLFEYCLIRELSSLKIYGEEKERFRKERWAGYESGTFDYSADAKRSEEILIRMQDVHFPEGAKKLKEVSQESTYEELLKKQEAQKKLTK
ncbi:MAG TPA: hypothetical protein DCE23_04825 [Firmicutes bacterium]|nr:hypothetical protein [Bacillota bacterium]